MEYYILGKNYVRTVLSSIQAGAGVHDAWDGPSLPAFIHMRFLRFCGPSA